MAVFLKAEPTHKSIMRTFKAVWYCIAKGIFYFIFNVLKVFKMGTIKCFTVSVIYELWYLTANTTAML